MNKSSSKTNSWGICSVQSEVHEFDITGVRDEYHPTVNNYEETFSKIGENFYKTCVITCTFVPSEQSHCSDGNRSEGGGRKNASL